jgi:hypothetical protein
MAYREATVGGKPCGHREPLAVAPFVIRWGPHASSDLLRQRLRCSKCGSLGAVIHGPSWGGMNDVGPSPFPVTCMSSYRRPETQDDLPLLR